MHKMLILLVLVLSTKLAYTLGLIDQDLASRFPDTRSTVRRRAYVNLLRNIRANKYGDITDKSDREMDMLMKHEIWKLPV